MTALARLLRRTHQRAAQPRAFAFTPGRALRRGVPGAPGLRAPARPGGPSAYASPAPVHFPSDPNSIVTVNVRTITAPTPNTYQQTGCFVSFGATSMKPMEVQELTQREDLAQVVHPPMELQSLVWGVGGLVTGIVAGGTLPMTNPGDTFLANITENLPQEFNQTAALVTVIDDKTFTYTNAALSVDPGLVTDLGVVQPADATELSQMVTTYFDQGNAISVYVLELGAQLSMPGRASLLETWLGVNPRSFYGYLMPRACGSTAANIQCFFNLAKQYENPEAMTYFWFTVEKGCINVFDQTMKCIIQYVEPPAVTEALNLGDPYGEFSAAAMFYNALQYKPSNALRIAPMAFKFLYGVTQYPTQNNGPTLEGFKNAATNYTSNGAEGGISFNMVYSGVTKDGMDYFNWWWTIDWIQIQVNIDLSNAIINGSNNPLAPLYYDQTGIDTLHSTLAGTMGNARSFGMVVGTIMMSNLTGDQLQAAIDVGTYEGVCNVNAVPFIPYAQSNPGDYKIGEYDGLSALFIPKRGFIHVLVTIAASQLVTI